MGSLNTVQKVWKVGNSTAISIPKKIMEIMGLEVGDYVQVSWDEIIKATKSTIKGKKELNKDLPEL